MAVTSDVVVEADWDNDGDFSASVETITHYVESMQISTGRDWPSQAQGRATPGRLTLQLRNDDNRFNYFNTSSPLVTSPFSLKSGRKIRVRTSASTPTDPTLYAVDLGNGSGSLGTTDNGLTWTTHLGGFTRNGSSQIVGTGSINVATVPTPANNFYVQAIIDYADGNIGMLGGGNRGGIVYRATDGTNFGLVYWLNGLVGHTIVTGGLSGTITTAFIDDYKTGVVLGAHVSSGNCTVYINGVEAFTATARSGPNNAGLYSQYYFQRQPRWEEFYVWDDIWRPSTGVLFTGDLTSITTTLDQSAAKTATLEAEGWLGALAGIQVDAPNTPGDQPGLFIPQTAGQAVGLTLGQARRLHPPYEGFAGGVVSLGAVGLDRGDALEIARKFEATEAGFLHETPEGPITFDARNHRTGSTSQATFSDASGATLTYEAIQPLDQRRDIINQVASRVAPMPPRIIGIFGGGDANLPGIHKGTDFQVPGSGDGATVGMLYVVVLISTIQTAGHSWTTPPGWTTLRDMQDETGRLRAWAKVLTAGDLGATVTPYDNSVEDVGGSWRWNAYLVDDWYGSIQGGVAISEIAGPPQASTEAQAGTVDPPTLLTPWGKAPSLYVAVRTGAVSSGGAISVSAAADASCPDAYGLMGSDSDTPAAGHLYDLALQDASRVAVTSVEDPTPFLGTFTGFDIIEAGLIAVRGYAGSPPESSGGPIITSNDLTSQADHNAIRSHPFPGELFRDSTDATTYNTAVLAIYASDRPIIRIGYTANKSSSYRTQAFTRRLSDRITVTATHRAGQGFSQDFYIEAIHHRFSNGTRQWYVEYELSPV